MFQIIRESFGRGVTQGSIFLEAFQGNGFQIAINSPVPFGRSTRIFVEYLPDSLVGSSARERRLSRKRLVKNCTQTVNIGGGCDAFGVAASLFRSHVRRCAEDGVRVRQRTVLLSDLGKAEVRQIWTT